MPAYALDKLLDIRHKREDDLTQELTRAKQAIPPAEQAALDAKREHDDFAAQKPQREQELYNAVLNQIVRREQLDALKIQLAELDRHLLALAEKQQRAEQELQRRQQEAETARLNLLAATKNRMKLDTHKDAWLQEEKKRENDRLEAEAADRVTAPNYVGEDDDSL